MLVVLMALCLVGSLAVAKEPVKFEPSSRVLIDCANAIPINCGDVVTGDNTGLPSNFDSYGCGYSSETGGEIFYVLTLTQIMEVSVALSGMTADLDVFLGTCDEDLNCIAYGNVSFTTTLEAGDYYIVVDGYYGAESAYTLTVDCVEPQGDPDCEAAEEAVEYMNYCSGAPKWYHFTAPIDGCIWINTCLEGQAVDTRVYVYSNCFGSQIGYNDDLYSACPYYSYASFVDVPVAAGDDLYIYFDDYWSSAAFEWELLVTDCVVANEDATWGAVKSLYE
jgi:hypothetical protein